MDEVPSMTVEEKERHQRVREREERSVSAGPPPILRGKRREDSEVDDASSSVAVSCTSVPLTRIGRRLGLFRGIHIYFVMGRADTSH